MFPGRTAGSGMGSSSLDAPPPSPVNPSFSDLQNPGNVGSTGLGAPARQLPPEVLMGIIKSGETISGMFDDIAQMVPDIAPEIAGAKDLLQRALAKLVLAGGAPSSMSSVGREFPGSAPFPPSNGNPT
jgi:hypothetical protein